MTTIRALAAIATITGPYLAGVALHVGIVIAAATLLTLLGCAAPAIAGWLLRDVPGWPAELLRQRFGVKPPACLWCTPHIPLEQAGPTDCKCSRRCQQPYCQRAATTERTTT